MRNQMKCCSTKFLLPLLPLFVAIPLHADQGDTATQTATQSVQPEETTNDTTETFLDEIIVRGDLSQKNLEASSSVVLTQEQIANRVYESPLEIVSMVPGVSVKQYKQGGTAASIQMRGFSSISHGSDAAIYVDGIPLNEGDGYADTNIINPDELERAEVIKGPISPLYGNYASAGVIHFYTVKKVEEQRLKMLYGSYNTYEGNYLGGFTTKDGNTDHVYSLQTYHTDGYQDNSEWDKQNAAARITHHFTDDFTAGISLRGFNSDWDAPGWLSEEQFKEDPEQSANDTNGGSKDHLAAKLDADYQLSSDSKILFQAFSYDQNFKRYYAGSETGLADGTVVGNLRDFDRLASGAGTSYNTETEVFDRELSFTLGADYLMEKEDRKRWRLTAGNGRNKGEKYLDYDVIFESVGLYTDAKYEIIEPLKVWLGGRYDHFSGEITDHLLNDLESSMDDTDIFSPKGGVVLTLLEERLELFVNYGQGFAMMSGFAEQAQYTQDNWDPQKRTQYEVGIGVYPLPWLEGRVVGFNLQTTDDFIQDPQTLEYENAGETSREGVEVTVEARAFEHGYLRADYTYTDATYDDYTVDGVAYDGNNLPNVPQDIANAELGYNPFLGFGGWLRYHYESGMDLDRANTVTSDDWDRIDGSVFYKFGTDARYMLALELLNIFDEDYAATTSYWSGTKSYSPGLPLSGYLTFTVNF